MGLWNIEILTEAECGSNRWILFDSCSMTPLAVPSFLSYEESEGFLRFTRALGTLDVRRCDVEEIDALHAQWHAAGRPTWDEDDEERETVPRLELEGVGP